MTSSLSLSITIYKMGLDPAIVGHKMARIRGKAVCMQHVSHLSWEAGCQMKLSDETDTQVSSVTRTVSMGLGQWDIPQCPDRRPA